MSTALRRCDPGVNRFLTRPRGITVQSRAAVTPEINRGRPQPPVMSNEPHAVSDTPRPRASIPPGEAEAVQRLVRAEVANVLALHKADLDLEYRVKRYRELANRYRALRAEEAEVKRQMRELNLPPQLLRTLKEE